MNRTMYRFALALSRTPRISRNVMARVMKTAGTLKTPPSSGAAVIAVGSVKPKVLSRNALRFAPQPIATAATETPYSRMRSQPMIQATISPSVA